jgi:LytS/YehU family sensor histidine kinase
MARFSFLAASFVLTYSALRRAHLRYLSSGGARMLGILLMAPVASMLSFAADEGAGLGAYLSTTKGAGSFVVLTLTAWISGLGTAAVALRFERKAREQAERTRASMEKQALERDLLETRLRLLQAQIEPHFLFNTLANVQALVGSGSPHASTVLGHLIAYLRAAMPHLEDGNASLGAELKLVHAYLELMRMRMPDRLTFDLDVDPGLLGERFPAMLLLTLVENAVRHGIDPAVDGGRIEVGGRCEQDEWVLWVEDTGVGMCATAPAGKGLASVRSRLQTAFGERARVALHEVLPHGVRVELRIPSRPQTCTDLPR